MSATYKCNFCGVEMYAHTNSKSQYEHIKKELYRDPEKHGDPGIELFSVKLKVGTFRKDLDVCDECLNAVKNEVIEKISKTKLE